LDLTSIRYWPIGASLGEGPVWVEAHRRLYFVDIKAPAVHALDPADGRRWCWPVPTTIGWLIPNEDGSNFVAGFRDGFARLWLEPELRIEYIARPHLDLPSLRLNDAKRDRWGRIWAGSMNDADPGRPWGRFYRLDPDGACSVVDSAYHICNGPTFSPDGRTLYHTDSWMGRIYAYDLDEHGCLGRRWLWRQFPPDEGLPDGMCTDEYGCLWIAHWGGSRVSRFGPDAQLLYSIGLPASQITSCTLVDGQRLFVTSARTGLDNQALAQEPLAGAVFEITL
jgi:sugar lactone lactonase YvrE